MTTFRQLLDQFEASAKTRSAKGRTFERFCRAFFRTDPYWAERFDEVWMWGDWPGALNHGDTGIDLVARERGTGNLTAIQCKFYSPDATLSWSHVGTFAGMLGHNAFSEGIIVSTAGAESANVHKNLDLQGKPIHLWRVADFEASRVDWDQFRIDKPAELALRTPKGLFEHQKAAIDDVIAGFAEHDRGQLVMACGTGKTFTSLRLAERLVGPGGAVLFLVPSISLLSQAVLAWANDAIAPLSTFAVCSDAQAGRRRNDDEDMSPNDLSFPASTDAEALVEQVFARATSGRMSVIFSTYQSIDVITQAQDAGLGQFDLVICDEAHRTTGAFKVTGEDQSAFTKVHDDAFVSANRRLYMTATPRIYGDQAQAKAAKHDVIVASMDDEEWFGPVFHELRFGEAVAKKLLTDYRVLVLAVNEEEVSAAFQRQLSSKDSELSLNDVARMVGCWHGLSKRGPQFAEDNAPMQRAVAFSSTIKQSKAFTAIFPEVVNQALEDRSDQNAVKIEAQHVDGSTNVKVRSEAIAWLEEPPGQRVCRVLSNAKCLTEGVDVPALDAVLFLNPRKSIVDVVQAVGRVMRRAEGKDYGYVILPIGVPAGVPPEEALRDNQKYQVVWQVLQALRSHDERLAAEINKIDINGGSTQVIVDGVGIGKGGGGSSDDEPTVTTSSGAEPMTLDLPDLQEWRDALYAKIVEKVGDRRYMETWAADISKIASAQETRIRTLLSHPDQNPLAVERFENFHAALRMSLNDGITRDDAIGMLSQHLITRPVFEALFGGQTFTRRNPVSQVMQDMVDALDASNIASETKTLEGFYDHIQMLIGDINSAEGRQRVITELYEKFFRKALPKTAESLGIVYTPIEIVDFILRGADELLRRHFDGASISDEGVHVLDPFTGTGTFIARLLQSGLIRDEDLERKYASELHANEIMLLAYYIAAINIETAYEGLTANGAGLGEYEPFQGVVLTDTFALSEGDHTFDRVFFPSNNERADRQRELDIRVIIGNPPYAVDDRREYASLDASIRATYVADATDNVTSLYDSYIRAYRLASDRIISSPDGGLVGFVSNGGWLESRAGKGVRASIAKEFHHVYVVNLRGNARKAGEERRREGGGVFGEGSRNTIAITFLVREPGGKPLNGAQISYFAVGDFMTRKEKLRYLEGRAHDAVDWTRITPNSDHDWVEQRDTRFSEFLPLSGPGGLFSVVSNGANTGRDAWVFNSSISALTSACTSTIETFNRTVAQLFRDPSAPPSLRTLREGMNQEARPFVWTEKHRGLAMKGGQLEFDPERVREARYRPFFPQNFASQPDLSWSLYRIDELFPQDEMNLGISLVDRGSKQPFGALGIDGPISLHFIGSDATSFVTRWRFPLSPIGGLLGTEVSRRERVSNLEPSAVLRIRNALGGDVEEDLIFAYVYGVLHSPEFRGTFAVNLKKEAPRIPLVEDRATFDAFAAAGQELLDLHVGYETLEPHPLTEEWGIGSDPETDPRVLLVGAKKMAYPKVAGPDGKKVPDKTRLIYNEHLTLSGIPLKAHEYVLGTRSGVDWIIDRWHVKTDKASGIVNDVNQWGLEHGQPRYIIDLIGRVVALSVRTVDIVNSLPKLTF